MKRKKDRQADRQTDRKKEIIDKKVNVISDDKGESGAI